MAFVNGKAAGEYSGERSAGAIKNWALGLVPNHVTTLNKQQQVRPRRMSLVDSHPTADLLELKLPTLVTRLHNLSGLCLVM
jgi:hypothetical protein